MSIKATISFVALAAGAVVSFAAAWPHIEPYLAAHRGYVREVAEEMTRKNTAGLLEVQRTSRNIQIDIAHGKHEAVDNDLFKAQLEQKKATDPQTQEFIQQQIIKLQETKSRIERQLNVLDERNGSP